MSRNEDLRFNSQEESKSILTTAQVVDHTTLVVPFTGTTDSGLPWEWYLHPQSRRNTNTEWENMLKTTMMKCTKPHKKVIFYPVLRRK